MSTEQSGGIPRRPRRSAREIIDAAILENGKWDTLCWALVVAFPLIGLLTLVYGAYTGEGLVSLSGAIAGSLFWPALANAVAIRKVNVSIRLLEVPLADAATARDAAQAIKDVFLSHFGKDKKE